MDDLLPQVGEFGRYQKLMLWLVCLPACFPCGFCAFNQLFMANVPEHWCYVSELSNMSQIDRLNLAIPKNNQTYSSCERYKINWTEVMQEYDGELDNVEINETWSREQCFDGWEYNKTEVLSSIVIDVIYFTIYHKLVNEGIFFLVRFGVR